MFEYVGFKIVEIPHWTEEFPRYTTPKREISADVSTVILPALTELAEMGATHYTTICTGKIPGRCAYWLKVNGFSEGTL